MCGRLKAQQVFVARVTALATERHLSIQRLSSQIRSKGWLGNILRGDRGTWLAKLDDLCEALDVPIRELFDDSKVPKEPVTSAVARADTDEGHAAAEPAAADSQYETPSSGDERSVSDLRVIAAILAEETDEKRRRMAVAAALDVLYKQEFAELRAQKEAGREPRRGLLPHDTGLGTG